MVIRDKFKYLDKISSHNHFSNNHQPFHEGVPYLIENSSLIWRANQWTDFYMIGTSIMK